MDFIFMFTRDDQTVEDCLEVFEAIRDVGLSHLGFKDVGVDARVLGRLTERIKRAGGTTHLEVVSTTAEACLRSARAAVEIGVDRLLGGTEVEPILDIVAGRGVAYYPFPGHPEGHPTRLRGSPHLLHDQAYREAPFALLAEDEPALLAEPEALVAGERDAIARLARTLVLSGFGMTICGGSYPASQGEHLISHYVDMRGPAEGLASFHGEQIGVTTLTMARLQERVLAGRPPRLGPTRVDEAALGRHFGPDLGRACWVELSAKRLDRDAADRLSARLTASWDAWRERLTAVSRASAALHEALRRAGAPTMPEELGWSRIFYREAVRHARLIRGRFTFLDLADDAGILGVARL